MELSELKPDTNEQSVDTSSLGQAVLIAASLAITANTIILVIARWLFDVPSDFAGLQILGVAAITILGTLLAAALLLLLGRSSNTPFTIFVIVAAVVAIVSMVVPQTVGRDLAGASDATVITQSIMHAVVAFVVIPILYRYPRQYWPDVEV